MKTLALFAVLSLASLLVACSKTTESAAPAAAPDCPAVVEKIAALNPANMRGPAERKLWGSMCAAMTPAQKTCTMAAKAMPEMQACMKDAKK